MITEGANVHLRANKPNLSHKAPLFYLQKNPDGRPGFTTKHNKINKQRVKFHIAAEACKKEHSWKDLKGEAAKKARQDFAQCIKKKIPDITDTQVTNKYAELTGGKEVEAPAPEEKTKKKTTSANKS